ncbi:MlaA family lipoprotein [Croceicoccus naphthovorans]|uniref:MlaA family lipoprotein n=1 Tax=Croceicoccus naphthovorans TaxID=1348774 RepID=UPI00069FC5E9|nr:VacJ family lipoprotein [Croceicoccus naphthovorans]MBB3990556.1 phospholipid-binding lipoprotein MlaA [Croceicoccus naphthovorans]
MVVSTLAVAVFLGNAGVACTAEAACADAMQGGSPVESTVVTIAAQGAGTTPPLTDETVETPQAVATQETSEVEATADEGEAILVTGEVGAPEGDPAEAVNVQTYKAAQAVDEAVVEPLAHAYDKGLPKPIRDGVGNFLSNLGEVVNFINFTLQLKPGRAFKAAGRFAINSTLGIGGLFDHASKAPFNIPHERNGFANTLGYYGVGSGPYLYLPLIGSTTVRDLFGRVVDLSIVPAIAGPPFNSPYYSLPLGALHSLEDRVQTDAQIDTIRERCGDDYAATRDIYLLQRQARINALRNKEVKSLSEIAERLEFNCDIDVFTAGVRDGDDFIRQNTTLMTGESGNADGLDPVEPEMDEVTKPEAVEETQPEAEIPIVEDEFDETAAVDFVPVAVLNIKVPAPLIAI